MRFHYIASQPDGKIVEDKIEAGNVNEVLKFLADQGLKPVSIKPLKGFRSFIGKGLFSESINTNDKIFLTKYLGLMLKVGTNLFQAIDILIADFDKPALKVFLGEVRSNLEKGQPFYVSFAKYPKFFDSVFVNLIKAGETSGKLDQILERLSISLEKEQEIKSRIKSALIYPCFLLTISFLVLFFLVSFAVPKIAEVFGSGGFQLPIFSRIVFAVGFFLKKYLLLIGGLIVAGIFALFFLYKNSPVFKKFISDLMNYIPLINNLLKKMSIQRFASVLSSLIDAGLPFDMSIEITAQAVGNEELKNVLMRISRQGLTKGLTITEAFRREKFFPRVVVNLIAISEKAGHVEEILVNLGDFYEKEVDALIKSLVSLFEPLLLMIMGVVVGIIALSIIVPIYQLTGAMTKF